MRGGNGGETADGRRLRVTSRMLRFAVVGVLSTLADFAVLMGLTALGMPEVPANTASFALATVGNYLASTWWVYADGERAGVVAFCAGATAALLVNDAVVWLATPAAGLFAAKVLATAASTAWNWFTRLKMFHVG